MKSQEKSKEAESPVACSSKPKKKFASLFCAICSEDDFDYNLHTAGSLHATQTDINAVHSHELTIKWKEMAAKVGNSSLLNLLAQEDLESNEIYYHRHYYNYMAQNCEKLETDESIMDFKWKKAAIFASKVSHILDAQAENPGSSFAAREFNAMYVKQLQIHGIQEKVNTKRFTEGLVKSLPELHIETIDNKTRLVFKRKVKELIGEYVKCPDDFLFSVRTVLCPARKEMADQCNEFDGSFNNSSQFTSIPKSLLCLVSTLIDGSSPTDNNFIQETLSVAQIIMWNYRKSNKKVNDRQLIKRRHAMTHETPMMIYIPLEIYSVTCSRNLIDMPFNLGLCISYGRVLEITKNIYENLCESCENNKLFFPSILKMGRFTVMLKDNIDLNSKSNSIQ